MIRIVKMCFKEEHIDAFKALFEERKATIRAQEGCTHLELLQDINNPQIFFTYSFWNSEQYLDQYRNSDFFADTWQKTKALFADKAAAWSVDQQVIVP